MTPLWLDGGLTPLYSSSSTVFFSEIAALTKKRRQAAALQMFLLRGKSLEEIRQLSKTEEFQRFAGIDDKLDTLAAALQNSPLFKIMLRSEA